MIGNLNTFQKVTILVMVLLIPIIILYSYSNYVSEGIVKDEINIRNINRLSVSLDQLESNVDQLSMFLVALSMDSHIHKLRNLNIFNNYEKMIIKKEIIEKLKLYWGLSNWSNELMIYLPKLDITLGTSNQLLSNAILPEVISENWQFVQYDYLKPNSKGYFVRHLVHPVNANSQTMDLVLEAKIPIGNIEKHLQSLIEEGNSDPFFYHDIHGTIIQPESNQELVSKLTPYLTDQLNGDQGNITIHLGNEMYLVSYVKSSVLDWILVDYVPLKKVLSPITFTRNLFYISVISLLLMGLFASVIIYRNVHLPIRNLTNSIHQFEMGDYSTRISPFYSNEFNTLSSSFNSMANKIQLLIEEVYEERIRRNEANLKQLQAQIDPHFLYNCLFYIKNMAKINNTKSVEAMSLHLGEYYRYMTRVENTRVTVREELKLVENYLSIFCLRTQRLEFEINMPEEILDMEIPRLLIQPIVENAIKHGLEPKSGAGKISICGFQRNNINTIRIEDSGLGVSDKELIELRETIGLPMTKDMGCGVWNVHQRIVYQFQGESGLRFEHSSLGGLSVEIVWQHRDNEVLFDEGGTL